MPRRPDAGDILLGALFGAVAGGVASYAMNAFQSAWLQLDKPGEPDGEADEDDEQESEDSGSDPTTVVAAETVARPVLGRDLRPEEKQAAGPAVHYGFGIVLGAVYGAIAEVEPRVTSGGGTLYGAGTWAAVDELFLPMSGIAGDPTEYPASVHVYGFTSHLVFGGVLELVRCGLRRLLR